MKAAIICIGNRFVGEDAAGPAVYDRLQQMSQLPDDIEVIDGGLMGLNLLPLLEREGRVVFVDAVSGYGLPGEIVVLDQRQIVESIGDLSYDHNAGLGYLLAILPQVCEKKMPEEIVLVGIEGTFTKELIAAAATRSLELAINGKKDPG